MINLFGSIIPIVLFLTLVNSKIDEYATDLEVVGTIQQHVTDSHEELEQTVINIYLLNLQARIERLIRAECQDPAMRNVVEEEVRTLIRLYNDKSRTQYTRPSCASLQVG